MSRVKRNEAINVAVEILQKLGNSPLSPMKFWNKAVEFGLDSKLNFKGKTPWESFSRDIYMDVKNNLDTPFEIYQERPKLVVLKNNKVGKIEQKINETISDDKFSFHERDLHQLLVNFIYSNENFYARAKTIYHEKSQKNKKGADKWVYPDIVAARFEYESFTPSLTKFIDKYAKLPITIYSFEMKKELNVGNFREYYFQAVSNSSWANEGYLVALNVDVTDEELMELIKKLNNSFGIGVISLNPSEIAQSEILARAKFNNTLDFSVVNDLSNKNIDFSKFLETIRDYDTKNPTRFNGEFDKILDNEALKKYVKDKKIG
ncbi:HrgA protein [Campylobacter sp. JMF_04 NA10]|uniref:HrgA protein n=1 Tax=Campylobacter sp. JMF_04 NA10 TaxID=2983824 RepID=UPI0022E9B389|nr:HrgA protein [Campylobacter sp. JMF_04 NA10]MDA3076307.1 HrgA protein [Campylobacter sp. JMF_04 NA10]